MSLTLPAPDLYVGGSRITGEGDVAEVLNPATEEIIGKVPSATARQCDAAIAAARNAFDVGPWSMWSGRERGAAIARFQAALAGRIAEIAAVVTAEVRTTAAITKTPHVV